MQGECRARGLENLAAVDDPQRVVHAQAQPLEHGGEVPGIDAASIDRGLATDRLQPRAVEKGRQQWMMVERLVEPRDGAGGALMRGEQGRVGHREPRRGVSSVSSIRATGRNDALGRAPIRLVPTGHRNNLLPVAHAMLSDRHERAAR